VIDLTYDLDAMSDLLERLVSNDELVVKVTDGLLHVHHPAAQSEPTSALILDHNLSAVDQLEAFSHDLREPTR